MNFSLGPQTEIDDGFWSVNFSLGPQTEIGGGF